MSNLSRIFSKASFYGYCKYRSISLAQRGLRNNSLCSGYEIGMIENFKEYDGEKEKIAFFRGFQAGRFFADMTNLAEMGRCMTQKWFESQKFYQQQVDMHEKWLQQK